MLMFTMKESLYLVVWTLVRYAECTCTFPSDLTGTWISSDKGFLNFTSTTVSSYQTSMFGTLSFMCDSSSGNKYVAKSTNFTHATLEVHAYLCFVFTKESSVTFIYYLGSTKNSNANDERIQISGTSSPLDLDTACNRTSFDTTAYSILVKNGAISSANTMCPATIIGQWTYTYDNGSGNKLCGHNTAQSTVDVCTDQSIMTFSYSKCSQNIMYSAVGKLYCLYSKTSGSTTYLTMYNSDSTVDGNSTYRYTCVAITGSGNFRYLSQYPEECVEGQTSTTVSSPGAYLQFHLSSSCPTDNTSASVVEGIVISLAIIIIVVVIVYFALNNYKKNRIEERVEPNPKFRNREITDRRTNIEDDVIHVKSDQNDNVIHSETSTVISMSSTARDCDTLTLLSSKDDYGHNVDFDDTEYEVNELNSFNGVPEIDVESATPVTAELATPVTVESATPVTVEIDVESSTSAILGGASVVGMDAEMTSKKKKKKIKTRKIKKKAKRKHYLKKTKEEVGHLNTSDKITFGTFTLLLKLPPTHKKIVKKKRQERSPVTAKRKKIDTRGNEKTLKIERQKERKATSNKVKKSKLVTGHLRKDHEKKNLKISTPRSEGLVVHRRAGSGGIPKSARFADNPVDKKQQEKLRSYADEKS